MSKEISLEVLGGAINSNNHVANFSKNYDGVYVTVNFYHTQSFIISWLYIKIGPYSDSAFGASYNPQKPDLGHSMLWAAAFSALKNITLAPVKKELIWADLHAWLYPDLGDDPISLEEYLETLSDIGKD